jgi:hypothetical protein
MRYLRLGYIAVFFTPFLAICFYLIFFFSWNLLSAATMSIICVQMFGLILCLLAINKDEDIPSIDRRILTTLPSDILLILMGIFAILLGLVGTTLNVYTSLNLTIWGQLLPTTFVIEGLLWIASGIVFNAIFRAIQDFSAGSLVE